ncbi:MAG: hypothetical protein PHF21_01235 [Bacilli bacterium]|nr:hypothetical protein [Bacilli bacterium]
MKKINNYEYNSTLFLLARPLFLGFGIYQIINQIGSFFWISIILGIFLGLIINECSKFLSRFKALKIVISIILLVYVFYTLTSAISTLYLNKTPKFIILAALLLVVIYSRNKNKDTIFKIANIFFIINITLFFIMTFSLLSQINYQNFELITKFSVLKIINSSVYFALLSTLPYLTLPNFKENYNYKAYLFSSIYTLILFTLIVGILGIPVASIYKYPEYIIFKKISILNIFENVQNFLFISWIFECFILLGITSNNLSKKTLLILLFTIFILYTIFITKFNILFVGIY